MESINVLELKSDMSTRPLRFQAFPSPVKNSFGK